MGSGTYCTLILPNQRLVYENRIFLINGVKMFSLHIILVQIMGNATVSLFTVQILQNIINIYFPPKM